METLANLERVPGDVTSSKTLNHASDKDSLVSNSRSDDTTSEACVVCLDQLIHSATALPCRHDHFHFLCLVTWLQQNRACPLCKREVTAVQYRDDPTASKQIFLLQDYCQEPNVVRRKPTTHTQQVRRRSRRRLSVSDTDADANRALLFRKYVYEHKLRSLYVGSNAISRYQSLTPHIFSHDELLIAKAKKWIRRELRVFDSQEPSVFPPDPHDRRANNAEFLLSYIIAILKSIDIRGSAGQAMELLQDFLGRDNAGLFLHELEAFLRSPYQNLSDWDKAVQYRV